VSNTGYRREGRVVAAHVGGELAFLGFFRGAAERRVEHARAFGLQVRGDAAGRIRVGGGGVDHDQPRVRAFEHAARAEDRRLDLDRGGEAEKEDIAGACDFGRAPSLNRTALHQIIDRRAIAMTHDGERMPLLQDVLRRAVAHQPDADVADFFFAHFVLLWRMILSENRFPSPIGVEDML
jgi:hypothetical protein